MDIRTAIFIIMMVLFALVIISTAYMAVVVWPRMKRNDEEIKKILDKHR